MNEEIAHLRAAILTRSKTVYACCRDYKLPTGTVYQILRGRYAGNYSRQIARICKVLEGGAQVGPGNGEIIEKLSALACGQCEHGKRRCRKLRHQCTSLWEAQAMAMRKLWEARSNEQNS